MSLRTSRHGHHNIYFGERAGDGKVAESYQFILSTEDDEYSTTLAPDEYWVIRRVLERAVAEAQGRPKRWQTAG
jgi:hypothetical protein